MSIPEKGVEISNKTEEQQLEKEKNEILQRYRHLMRLARPYMQGDDTKKIKKAFQIATEAHGNVRRKSGEPYIFHPIEVARIVVEEMGLGTTSIICALLHDVVEDSDIPLSRLEKEFGSRVAKIIDGLTKVPSDMFGQEKSQQAETFRKVLLTISEDIRVVLIKIADRLHNMRTLESMPNAKQLKIKAETQFIYAPLAHRLGLYNIRSELDDLSLKYSNRKAYNEIVEHIKRTKASRTRFINEFKKPIEEELARQGLDFEVKSRMKSISSIHKKMVKQQIPFDEVYDLFAIRIILNTGVGEDEKAACWRTYSVVTDFYQPSPQRLRDWISAPKTTGYESLHTTVMSKRGQWVEVQIRTHRMDEIAEKGYAAHWKYKGGTDKSESSIEGWIARVRESIENKDLSALEFIDEFQNNFFSDEIYVFTPKGDLKVLPQGSTILDFAFDIHSEIGERCMGGKVNHKLVPLNYELQNGDQIEILVSSKTKVNEDWLSYVRTSKSKQLIRQSLKKDQKIIVEDGKDIVKRKLKQLKLDFNDETVNQLLDYFKYKYASDFYYAVGKGKIEHTQIKKFREEDEQYKAAQIKPKKESKGYKKKKKDDILMIGGDSTIEFHLSKCCHPIPGDNIFGLTTSGRGIRIHRTDCPNAVAIMASYGDRIISVNWSSQKSQTFEVLLTIIGADRMGLVNDVTRIISNQNKVNICGISFNINEETVFEGEIRLRVLNTDQVQKLIVELKELDGVVQVMRQDEDEILSD
ncbi:RelA/SpoT family protein [Bernardetia sp. ABR2-2B]|uniref:RelA/SpoT family protein n=1 Tax=Bernardetia sp. ABR2-2B TaxID=3127472 RepID=UPI0030CBD0AD